MLQHIWSWSVVPRGSGSETCHDIRADVQDPLAIADTLSNGMGVDGDSTL